MSTIGERIREARRTKKWRQEDLANQIGVVRLTIHSWEAGKREPHRCRFLGLARALGVDLDWLKFGTEPLPTIQQSMDGIMQRIDAQRETILRSFIAETGLKPSECEQVLQTTATGVKFWVQKREGA
jgi:transcriptional regulator with XRE-family HTH domain